MNGVSSQNLDELHHMNGAADVNLNNLKHELTALNLAPSPYDSRSLPYQSLMGSFPIYADRRRRHRFEIALLVLAIIVSLIGYYIAIFEFAHFFEMINSSIDHQRAWKFDHPLYGYPEPVMGYFLILPFLPLLFAIMRGIMWGQLKTNATEISPQQYPQVYEWILEIAEQYKLKKIPQAFVVSGNGVMNAFSSGHGYRRFIALYSDMFELSGQARDPEIIKFVLGHEMGHIAAGHTSWWRLITTAIWMQIPFFGSTLSRAQEYTADNYGYSYCPEGAAKLISVFGGGKYLYRHTDPVQFVTRAEGKITFFMKISNLLNSHPANIWRAHALFFRDKDGALVFSPKRRIKDEVAELAPLYSSAHTHHHHHYEWTWPEGYYPPVKHEARIELQ